MRIVYLGTSSFAASVLRRLVASSHEITLVVTRPDRPRGRGRKLTPPPVAETAAELELPLVQPESVNDEQARERIGEATPEAVCICAYGALIKEPLLSAHPMLNVHPSLLPRWRGAAPIERAIEAGDGETGVCIMRPVAEMDAGPVCLVGREPIAPDDDFGSLSARLETLAGELLVKALDTGAPFAPQAEEGITLAEKITAADRRLDPESDPAALERRVRALTPHVGAYVDLDGRERLGVRRARVDGSPEPPPGELAEAGGRLLFGGRGGALELLEVQPAGGRPMDAGSYIRGRGGR